jgi:histidinol-phosphate/aromatic aminotransferase/cobyric acid decarboxylase-like protein
MTENYNSLFAVDDYSELHKKYFKNLREGNEMFADPSGWTDTFSEVGLHEKKFDKRLQLYYCDLASNQLKEQKLPILNLLSAWDSFDYSLEHVTLCHSTTVGSMTVLAVLLSKGIGNIIFETPNYFATHYQAETLGMKITRVPSFFEENFQFNLKSDFLMKQSPCAVWLTQPRTALGYNQDPVAIDQIMEKLSPNDFLIIDEATEQMFPSVLNNINSDKYPNVIKIRSIFKGLGVNGLRLAAIIHHPSLRYEMTDEMEVFQGALDIYSLENAIEMAGDINRFRDLLDVSNQQVVRLRQKAERQVLGTNCYVSKIVNGYIGAAIIKFQENSLPHHEVREKFLQYCAKNKTPVIVGAAMSFSIHTDMEFVRLNYFNRENHILNALKLFSDFQIGGR